MRDAVELVNVYCQYSSCYNALIDPLTTALGDMAMVVLAQTSALPEDNPASLERANKVTAVSASPFRQCCNTNRGRLL